MMSRSQLVAVKQIKNRKKANLDENLVATLSASSKPVV
jgi:hypothetical protein